MDCVITVESWLDRFLLQSLPLLTFLPMVSKTGRRTSFKLGPTVGNHLG